MDADPPEADPGSGALSRIEEDPTVSDSAEPEEPCAEPPPAPPPKELPEEVPPDALEAEPPPEELSLRIQEPSCRKNLKNRRTRRLRRRS